MTLADVDEGSLFREDLTMTPLLPNIAWASKEELLEAARSRQPIKEAWPKGWRAYRTN